MMPLTRRRFIAVLSAVPALAHGTPAGASGALNIVVTRDPNCGCCGSWVDHLRASGFTAKVVETGDVTPLKQKLGVPRDLYSCHTAEVGRYAIEGHVPASAIRRLLSEAPQAQGLAVAGMPVGSPGMEVDGHPAEVYDVILFSPNGRRVFARFKGADEIKAR